MEAKTSSYDEYLLKRQLKVLGSKKGRGTELISVYIPPYKNVADIIGYLEHEYAQASNIKDKLTRTNVQSCLVTIIQRLKLFKKFPPEGLAVFCGAIPERDMRGTEKIEIYLVKPPRPIKSFIYRCSDTFYLEPLKELVEKKPAYGLIVMDRGGATIAILRGTTLNIVKSFKSGVPSKHSAGGQSQRRFERIREKIIHSYYKKLGEKASEILLQVPDLKGIIVGGPGPAKEEFVKGDYLHYELKQKVLGLVDTGYTGETGVRELIERGRGLLKEAEYVKEKRLVQKFLELLVKDPGMVCYGEKEVRKCLEMGVVDTLLLSEDSGLYRVKMKCKACGYEKEATMDVKEVNRLQTTGCALKCPKCMNNSLEIVEVRDVVEELGELARQTGCKVEVISTDIEEGQELKNAFGGIAAILRYKFTA